MIAFGLLSLISFTSISNAATVSLHTWSSSKAGRWLCSCSITTSQALFLILLIVTYNQICCETCWPINLSISFFFHVFTFQTISLNVKILQETAIHKPQNWHAFPKSILLQDVPHSLSREADHWLSLVFEPFWEHRYDTCTNYLSIKSKKRRNRVFTYSYKI